MPSLSAISSLALALLTGQAASFQALPAFGALKAVGGASKLETRRVHPSSTLNVLKEPAFALNSTIPVLEPKPFTPPKPTSAPTYLETKANTPLLDLSGLLSSGAKSRNIQLFAKAEVSDSIALRGMQSSNILYLFE